MFTFKKKEAKVEDTFILDIGDVLLTKSAKYFVVCDGYGKYYFLGADGYMMTDGEGLLCIEASKQFAIGEPLTNRFPNSSIIKGVIRKKDIEITVACP